MTLSALHKFPYGGTRGRLALHLRMPTGGRLILVPLADETRLLGHSHVILVEPVDDLDHLCQ